MAKSIFVQREVEKIYENYRQCGWFYDPHSLTSERYICKPKRYDMRYSCKDNVLSHKIIGEYNIDGPPLKVGEEFFLCDIKKLVKIHKRCRNSDGSFTYYIEDEYIETENTKLSKEKCEKDFDRYCAYVDELDKLRREFRDYKREYKYKNRFFNFGSDKAPNNKS